MKQNLKIGVMVDDGTGDYLRLGGQKINNNFDDLYYQLGDGENPHAAGAWKTWTVADGTTLEAVMGRSYAVNTSNGMITVKLPKGTPSEYNYVIRLRDVFATWQVSPVTIVPAVGDTMKGSPDPVVIRRNLADIELVYCSPGRWEYIDNKQIDKISNNDVATVETQQFIATEGQTDFLDVFNGRPYNIASLEVKHRGNDLFYGKDDIFDPVNAEFGSPGAAPGEIVTLDGRNIRLRMPCAAGDTVIVRTFNDGIAQYRSSYNRRDVQIRDSKFTLETPVEGSLVVADLSTKHTFMVTELAVSPSSPINPNACEVYINSILQHEAGTANYPAYTCEGADGETAEECTDNGGQWSKSKEDYITAFDEDNRIESFEFARTFEDGDILSIVWYNNDIGTTMTLDEITDETNNIYVSQGPEVSITGDIRITDYDNPFAPNLEPVDPSEIKPSAVSILFNMFHPIGTIYENTTNPNNPATYMGMGTWKRLEERVLIGWSSDPASNFHTNNNDLDSSGVPQATAGGTGGNVQIHIKSNNIPKIRTDEKVLVADATGPIIVGGCQVDPDAQGPAYTNYREDYATINEALDPLAQPIDTLPPYLIVYRWVRIA
ncbi:baseplate wedge subunit and tail pin [Escherichia phage vB_EcoM_VR20]|uniref:Baseplate wedge protein gp10 n=1 Tax=Escherichia phage vB_EcoM_VR20 TaxID=1567027 RepID=A0A0A7HC71_9CAUD|nr:baseplate wedge subunit [Escherichia phage vB_EcoM_VR20]AIZ02228.1 baseplate wedge subunit and tail pin [Escherichia phage vB_EcoM_VR20]